MTFSFFHSLSLLHRLSMAWRLISMRWERPQMLGMSQAIQWPRQGQRSNNLRVCWILTVTVRTAWRIRLQCWAIYSRMDHRLVLSIQWIRSKYRGKSRKRRLRACWTAARTKSLTSVTMTSKLSKKKRCMLLRLSQSCRNGLRRIGERSTLSKCSLIFRTLMRRDLFHLPICRKLWHSLASKELKDIWIFWIFWNCCQTKKGQFMLSRAQPQP